MKVPEGSLAKCLDEENQLMAERAPAEAGLCEPVCSFLLDASTAFLERVCNELVEVYIFYCHVVVCCS